MRPDHRTELVAQVSGAFFAELDRHESDESMAWPTIPTVRAMVGHLGGVHRWVVEVLRTRRNAADVPAPDVPWPELRAWFAEGRMLLLDALTAVDPGEPCWILGDRHGTAGFWRRRMVFETTKHLIDLRAAGGGAWRVAPELTPAGYADGVDELFEEFLSRSRPSLDPLPGVVALVAADIPRAWTIGPTWRVSDGPDPDAATRVTATAGDLALMLWERADPSDTARFAMSGDAEALEALRAAPIHPWRSAG